MPPGCDQAGDFLAKDVSGLVAIFYRRKAPLSHARLAEQLRKHPFQIDLEGHIAPAGDELPAGTPALWSPPPTYDCQQRKAKHSEPFSDSLSR